LGIVERFDDAWQRGDTPCIEDYLNASAGVEPHALLFDLVHVDLERRLKTGVAVRVEHYLQRFPQLQDDSAALICLLRAEHRLRQEREPGLGMDEYLGRFPSYEAQLRAEGLAPGPGSAESFKTADSGQIHDGETEPRTDPLPHLPVRPENPPGQLPALLRPPRARRAEGQGQLGRAGAAGGGDAGRAPGPEVDGGFRAVAAGGGR
jgi:hypothetical protein